VAGEFRAFLHQASRRYRNIRREECNVSLIELTDRILPALDPDLSKYALERLERRGLKVHLETSVERVESDHVLLSSGEEMNAHTVIWCAGIAPPSILGSLDLPVDRLGYLLCEPDMRIRGRDNIWGIGDCAVNLDAEGISQPATAQHAVREGVQLARNLDRVLRGRPAAPFVYSPIGALAGLGCRTGVAKVFGVKISGFAAWFLWRAVYLLKMPGWARRLRVALDWTADLLFPRDYVTLGIRRKESPSSMEPEGRGKSAGREGDERPIRE
jgi:NADH dehydrogenase